MRQIRLTSIRPSWRPWCVDREALVWWLGKSPVGPGWGPGGGPVRERAAPASCQANPGPAGDEVGLLSAEPCGAPVKPFPSTVLRHRAPRPAPAADAVCSWRVRVSASRPLTPGLVQTGQPGPEPVLSLFRACSEPVQSLFRACSEPVQSLFRACSEPVQSLFRACSEPVQSRFRACSEPVAGPSAGPFSAPLSRGGVFVAVTDSPGVTRRLQCIRYLCSSSPGPLVPRGPVRDSTVQ
ncbi:unnamed protein product [Arctogadus glacialis]